jgi:hypothetical protein
MSAFNLRLPKPLHRHWSFRGPDTCLIDADWDDDAPRRLDRQQFASGGLADELLTLKTSDWYWYNGRFTNQDQRKRELQRKQQRHYLPSWKGKAWHTPTVEDITAPKPPPKPLPKEWLAMWAARKAANWKPPPPPKPQFLDPRDKTHAPGDIALTCDGCGANFNSGMMHWGGTITKTKIKYLRELAAAGGWQTEDQDRCPQCRSGWWGKIGGHGGDSHAA